MTQSQIHPVLRRKAHLAREEHQARVMTPARAVRMALSRAADDLFDLPLAVARIQTDEMAQVPLINTLSDDNLLMLLDGPMGAMGVLSFDVQLLAGFIETQTTGRVIAAEAPARVPTQTDAAMIASLVDTVLAKLAEQLGDEEGHGWSVGFGFGAKVENCRMLGLVLEASDFHVFRVEADLGSGAKTGQMILALPVGEPEEAAGEAARETPSGEDQLTGSVLEVNAQIEVVLHRLEMSLAAASKLKAGDLIELPRRALAQAELEAGDGNILGQASLGQLNGFRAVRLRLPGAAPYLPELGGEDASELAPIYDLPDALPQMPVVSPEEMMAVAEAGNTTTITGEFEEAEVDIEALIEQATASDPAAQIAAGHTAEGADTIGMTDDIKLL